MKVLLVEDTAGLRHAMARGLGALGFTVEQADDGPSGLWAAQQTSPDVLVLDIGLPGFDGLELLRRLRCESVHTPALMLTAMTDLDDRLAGFGAGADDYVAKPVDVRELAARIHALARRRVDLAAPVVSLGDLELDMQRSELRRDGAPIRIRRRERALLELLAMNHGKVVTRAQIEAKLYRDEVELQSNSIDVAVSCLRRVIDRPGEQSRITTLRGEGYRLER
jgi:DNA-binding response OmpR family regulator